MHFFCNQNLYDHFYLPDGRMIHCYQKDKIHETLAPKIDYFPPKPNSIHDYEFIQSPPMPPPYWPKMSEKPIPTPQSLIHVEPERSKTHMLPVIAHQCTGEYCMYKGILPPESISIEIMSKRTNTHTNEQ